MSRRLIAPLTHDHLQDFFTIGKELKIDSVARSTLGGKNIDPKTGKAAVYEDKPFVPPYKRHSRHNNPNQVSYANYYQQQEETALLRGHYKEPDNDDDAASTTTGGMEKLDSLSMTTGLTGTTATVILPEGKTEDEANEVYMNYNFRHDYDKNLSIYQHREDIIATVESNQVTVIQGETGSGKTTQVPQYILDHYRQNNKYCNIVVTQPRRIAARSIATRVCHERNWEIGKICGYQVGMDKQGCPDTRLLYCTTGVLLQKLIGQKSMQDYTHVILDEVHERDQDSDFCLLVVRKLLRENSRDVKVVLMSATIDSVQFAKYFAVAVRGCLEPAPILEIKGRCFSVQEYYLENLQPIAKGKQLPDVDPCTPKIEPDMFELARNLIIQFDTLEIQQYQEVKDGLSIKRGSVLIFLPGLAEINELDDKLREIETSHKLLLYPLHSTITLSEQSRVFDKPPKGLRKVIMSTNIAESSITVPDIKYVIDFCLTKNLMADADTMYTSLQIGWASRANCTQRKGRAGRVSDGRVYRLVTRKFYEEYIPDYGVPEMQRCPLEIVVLKVKRLDMGEPKAILGLALSPPSLDDIECTILMLKEVGALASLDTGECNPHDGKLTFLGRVVADLPLDIRLGKLILLGHVFGLLEECVIISACLSMKSIFSKPYKAVLEAYRKKFEWADNSFSDCIAYLNAYKSWQHFKDIGRFPTIKNEMRWARENFIELRHIKEVEDMVRELLGRLSRFNIKIPQGPAIRKQDIHTPQNQLIIKVVLCGAFYPNYFTMGHVDEEDALRTLAGHNPHTTVMVKGLPINQGSLYRKNVEEIFARCDARGRKPRVHSEETRAYIEFVRDPTQESSTTKILPAVYLALKMRELRNLMEINLMDPETARMQLEQLSLLQGSQALSAKSLRSNRVMSTGLNPKVEEDYGTSGLQQVDLPPPEISTIPLCPTVITDCGSFWAQYADEDTTKKVLYLQENINMYNGKNLQPLAPQNRIVGSLCLAPYNDGSSQHFYRCRIEKLDNSRQIAHVIFIDYGNVEKVTYHTLHELEPHFKQLPFQAIECQLCNIKPSTIKCPNGTWTEEAKAKFKNIIETASRACAQIYSIVHGVLRVELYCFDGVGNRIQVNKKLVDLCYADIAEEDFQSKQNHKQREENTLSSPTNRLIQRADDIGPREDQFFNSLGGKDISYVRRHGGKFCLAGPSSPYETTFNPMTCVGRLRTCKIARESVNCISLDDEPHTKHTRMMVAAHVGLNPKGNSMMARDTTVMPSIPGLPCLMSLLFSPSCEIRLDPDRKKYIGALCGLGWDPETGGPALGDHDMEITFDIPFSLADLADINVARIFINMGIGTDETEPVLGQDRLIDLQKKVREKLLNLLQKRREWVQPMYYLRSFQWNQVNVDNILRPKLENVSTSVNSLYQLHCGVNLEDSDD